MNATEKPRLIDQVPFTVRQTVLDSGEFQRMCSDFVREGVVQNVGELISRLQETEGFGEEMEALASRADYVSAAEENDILIVDHDGEFYWLQWTDPSTFQMDTDGTGFIDFAGFAKHHGINLDDWAWNTSDDEPVLKSEVTADDLGDVDMEQPLLVALVDSVRLADGGDVIRALTTIAEKMGLPVAAALRKSSNEKLFGDFVTPASSLANDTFDSAEEAAEDACNSNRIEPEYREVYEHWLVNDWFARRLKEQGEVVADDLMGLTIWGRCTTGQSISMDGVISRMVREEKADEIDALVTKLFPNIGKHDEYLEGVPLDMVKALEEGRVKSLTFTETDTWRRDAEPETRRVIAVFHGQDVESGGWLLDDHQLTGMKSTKTPGAAVGFAELKRLVGARGDPAGENIVVQDISQHQLNQIVREVDTFHARNKTSELHKVPENLEERLDMLVPARIAKRAAEADGPSLG